jgi:hypothetical protein
MRQGQQNRRGRGRGSNNNNNNNHSNNPNNNRKPQNSLSRSYESSGPDVKIRGTAAQIAEKYIALARDASAAGDTVQAENYLQHAEHYNRIIMAAQAQVQPSPAAQGAYQPSDNVHALNGSHRPHMEGNGAMRDQPQPRIPQHQAPQPTIPHVAEASEADEQPSLPIAAHDSAQPVITESPKDETKEEPAASEPADGGRRRRRRYPAAAANGATRASSTEASNGNGKAIDVPDDGRSSDEALA